MRLFFTFLMSLAISPVVLANGVQKGTSEIRVHFEYAVMDASVACVIKYHPQSEGEEFPELYFVNPEEYKAFLQLRQEGYALLDTLVGGAKCSVQSGSMVIVGVGKFDKAEKIKQAVEKESAVIKGQVVLIKNNRLSVDVESQKAAIIESLIH